MTHKSVSSCHCVKSFLENLFEYFRIFFLTTPEQVSANFMSLLGLFISDPSFVEFPTPTLLGSIFLNLGKGFYRARKRTLFIETLLYFALLRVNPDYTVFARVDQPPFFQV